MEKNDKKKSGRSDRFWLFVQIAAGLVALGALGVMVWTWWGYRQSAPGI